MITSNDLIKRTNSIMEKLYFDGLSSSEQKIVIDKILLSYTKNKLSSIIDEGKEYDNFIELLYDIESSFEDENARIVFYNNYIKLFINLIGKKQKMHITWAVSDDVNMPVLQTRIAYGYIDKVITGTNTDPLVNLDFFYNLYKKNIKSYKKEDAFTYCKRKAI